MKKNLILLLLMVSVFSAQAQKNSIKEISGAPMEGRTRGMGWRNTFVGGFKHDNQNYALSVEYNVRAFYFLVFIAPSSYTPKLRLYKLDDKMNVEDVSIIDLMPKDQFVKYHSYRVVGDNLFIFFEFKNRKDKKFYFFCKKYSLIDKNEEILKIAERPYHEKGQNIVFDVNVSPDRKKFAVITHYIKKERVAKTSGTTKKKVKNTTTFDYVVLDEDMSVLSSGAKIKLDGKDVETVWEYKITPAGKLIVVSTEIVDFKEEAGATKAKKAKTKPAKGSKTPKESKKKFARRFYLNIYDDEEVIRIPVDEEKYQRGFYALPLSDSTMQIYSYFTENGKTTDGLMHSTLNLNTKTLENHQFASFSEIKGAENVAKDNNADEDEDDAKAAKKAKAKKTKKSKKKETDKFDNVVKNLYTIAYVDRLKDGSCVVFGEIFAFWVQVVTTYNSKGGSSTRVYYHYDYGPAGMVKIDSSGAIVSSTVVDYFVDYVDYDPGFAGLPMAVGNSGYMVVTNRGYSVVDFGKSTNKLKDFTSINNGVGRKGSGEIIRADNSVLMILTKKKSVTFSTLAAGERSAAKSSKKKKK